MTNEERRKAAELFRKRAKECPMPATRQMYKIATEALETPPNDNWEGYSSRLWKNAYERGKADAEQRWIPVSERLPEEDGDYFVTYEKGYAEDYNLPPVGIAGFDVNCESFGYWYEQFDRHTLGSLGSEWEEIKVIAWMPLPEPYKAESEDELDGDPVDIDKAVEHYEGTLETLKAIDLEVDE